MGSSDEYNFGGVIFLTKNTDDDTGVTIIKIKIVITQYFSRGAN